MIIKTDVRNIPFNRAPIEPNASAVPVRRTDTENTRLSMKNITERLSKERTLGDALSIAQMSQLVIQKAISVSLRLTSIASTAMVSGNVNTQALTEALSEIRSTMRAYGEQVPNPVQAPPPAKTIDMPDIGGALSSVHDIATTIQKGDYNQAEKIESVNKNLNERLRNYRIAESRITDLMRETTAGYVPPASVPSGTLVRQLTAAIEANPDNALSSQGNINHTTAVRLMG